MLSTSAAFRRRIAENTRFAVRATITLADGSTLELDGSQITMGGLSVTGSTSSLMSFDIGAAVVGTCDLTLANYHGEFDPYDFTGSTLAASVGAELESGTEWLLLGTFNVEQPDSYGSTIGLHCLDNLSLAQSVKYEEVGTNYPATLQTIVRDICTTCGLSIVTDAFPNSSYRVAERPKEDGRSCLDMLGYAAQVAGCFVRCDPRGRIEFRWYDTTAFEDEGWLDGGSFNTSTSPYSDGDEADGGAFMTGGDSHDGGQLASSRWAHLHSIAGLTVSTDDVVITGVSVTAQPATNEDGTTGEDGETSTFGVGGYVLRIADNPLIGHGRSHEVAAQVGSAVVGMRFRPFDATGIADPSWQAGDPIVVTDRAQRTYRAYLTGYTWRLGAYAQLSCGAETPARNSARRAEAQTRAIIEARRAIRAERTAREAALAEISRELTESSGLYMTSERQGDGSTIYYMHDKPTLADSTIVWKMTAEAVGVSTDGGRTYPYALDASGNAILNRVYAIGIDADYISTGRLESQVGGNFIDLDTGEMQLASTVRLGTKTVQQVLDGVGSAISGVDVEFAQNRDSENPPTSGWSTTAPQWRSGYCIWQRTKSTTANGTTYSDPTCISGRDGTGVSSSTVTYGTSGSAAEQPTSWSETPPASLAQGSWLWVRTVTTYTDGTDSTSLSKSYMGTDGSRGQDGQDGRNLLLHTAVPTYAGNYDATLEPSSTKGWYRYTSTVTAVRTDDGIKLTHNTSTTNGGFVMPLSRLNAVVGGDEVTLAFDYRGTLTSTGRIYLMCQSGGNVYASAKALTASETDWQHFEETLTWPSTDGKITYAIMVPYVNKSGGWIEIRDRSTILEKGGRHTGWSLAPEDVVGIDSTTIEYGTSEDASTQPTSWSTTPPASPGEGTWVWVRTTTAYTDGTSKVGYSKSHIGTDGKDGRSVSIQSVSKNGKVTTVTILDSDGTTRTLTISDGSDGQQGVPGPAGPDGESSYIHVAWANSADGSQGFSRSDSAGKSYLGVYTDDKEQDSTSPGDYSWSLIKGEAATTYAIAGSVDAIARASDGTISPASVTFSATSKEGSGTAGAYAGRIRILYSNDGTTYSSVYTSTANESSHTLSLSGLSASTRYVRAVLYAAGGTSTQLDTQTIPVVSDGTDGKDAYTVVLSNESHTFAGTEASAVADSTTCEIIAYKGATRVAATVGAITGRPAGMSTSVSNNGTSSATITVSVGTSMATKGGTLSIPITVDGKSFTRTFSFALALTGEAGTGVSSIVEQYYLSTSDSKQTGGSWTTTQPGYVAGRHYWTRSEVTWSDGTVTHTTPVLAQGLTGANAAAFAASNGVSAISTQEAIFNLLTNNGTVEGFFMEDGELYVNASYILSGILKVGGAGNERGTLQVLDADGNVVGTIDKDGASLTGAITSERVGGPSSAKSLAQTTTEVVGAYSAAAAKALGLRSQSAYASTFTLRAYDLDYVDGVWDRSSRTLRGEMGLVCPDISPALTKSAIVTSVAARESLHLVSDTSKTYPSVLNLESGYAEYWPQVSSSSDMYTGYGAGKTPPSGPFLYVSHPSTAWRLNVTGDQAISGNLTVSGTKSRVATAGDYGRRLLYAYETAIPMFGDVGSGTIGEDGTCVVMIDDVFAETVRLDHTYQVFLQACGRGKLWVTSKAVTHFVVEGTPGLTFDWEVKARQAEYESERTEPIDGLAVGDTTDEMDTLIAEYAEELAPAHSLENNLLDWEAA